MSEQITDEQVKDAQVMHKHWWETRIELGTYTYYPGRSEFVSNDTRFQKWVCVAPQSGKFEYEVGIEADQNQTDQNPTSQTEKGEAEFGDLIFARPMSLFNRRVISPSLEYHVLQWSFVALGTPAGENIAPTVWQAGKWRVRDSARLASTLAHLIPLLGNGEAWAVRRTEHLLEDLLHMAWSARGRSPVPDPLMNTAAQLLYERAGELLAMSEISRHVGLGPVQFTRRFRAAFDQNPVEYLTKIRLAKAQKMLIETSDTLDEIAVSCGWASGAYLSYVFERHFKVTPGRFRKRHRV